MRRLRSIAGALAVIALAGLVAGAIVDPAAAARGWLLGFFFAGLAPIGGLGLAMIARLTDAPWAETFAPELRAMVAAAPWLWLLAVPLAILLPWIYPWAGQAHGAPAHLRTYLSPALFILRGAIALGGWTVLAVIILRGRLSQLVAGLGLVFLAFTLCIVPNDWVLSLQPGWTTTDFPMTAFALQLAASTSAVLLLAGGRTSKDSGDIAGLLIAALLGLVYLNFMAWLVDWYGDLPDRVSWWLDRAGGGRPWIFLAAMACGAVALAALTFGRRYRLAGGAAFLAAVLCCAWLMAQAFAGWGWLLAAAGLAFQAALLALLATWPRRARRRPEAVHA